MEKERLPIDNATPKQTIKFPSVKDTASKWYDLVKDSPTDHLKEEGQVLESATLTGDLDNTILEKNLRYSGSLQDIEGSPYVTLYHHISSRQLYVFVRADWDDVMNDVSVTVTPQEVSAYMKNELTLTEIFKNKEKFLVTFEDDRFFFKPTNITGYMEIVDAFDRFNPDFCANDIWIKTLLSRIIEKKPLLLDEV